MIAGKADDVFDIISKVISKEYLQEHPNVIFIFGDNVVRKGKKGGAAFRDEPNSYGFITKRYPSYNDDAFYEPDGYKEVYKKEIRKLIDNIAKNPDKIYLISKVGSGLANRYKIFEEVIEPNMKKDLRDFKNVVFLW